MIQLAGKRFWFWRVSPTIKKGTPDGKEIIIEGVKEKHFGIIAPKADTTYLPIIEQNGRKVSLRADQLTLVGKEKVSDRGRITLNLRGKKVKFERATADKTVISRDGVEKTIKGKRIWVKATIAEEVFDTYLPVILDKNAEKTSVKVREIQLLRS